LRFLDHRRWPQGRLHLFQRIGLLPLQNQINIRVRDQVA
jgi:hypothetical protein